MYPLRNHIPLHLLPPKNDPFYSDLPYANPQLNTVDMQTSCGYFFFKVESCEIKLLLMQSKENSSIKNHWTIPKGQLKEEDSHEVRAMCRNAKEHTKLDRIVDYRMVDVEEMNYNYGILKNGKVVQKYVRALFAEMSPHHKKVQLSKKYESCMWVTKDKLTELFTDLKVVIPVFLFSHYMEAFKRFEDFYFKRHGECESAHLRSLHQLQHYTSCYTRRNEPWIKEFKKTISELRIYPEADHKPERLDQEETPEEARKYYKEFIKATNNVEPHLTHPVADYDPLKNDQSNKNDKQAEKQADKQADKKDVDSRKSSPLEEIFWD